MEMKKSNPENSNEKNKISRRVFLTSMGNTATGIVLLGSFGVTLEYLSPNVLLEIPKIFKVGPVNSIQPNSVIYEPEQRTFVVREEQGYFYALSAVCTHLGCTAKWNDSGVAGNPDAVISCPCHGSLFNKLGEVIQGPAIRGLDKYRIQLEEDKLVINTAEKVSEDEMILKV